MSNYWANARKALGLTQEEMSEHLGVSRRYLSMLETGKPQANGKRRNPRKSMRMLMDAYLDGYRPLDWSVIEEPEK